MQTICYLRVSSPKVNGKSRQKTDSQKLALKNYCQMNGIKSPKFIQDHATGRNQDREGFQKVMAACRSNKCQQIIIWKLDRMGRSMIETISTIRELMALNVQIVVTTQGLIFDQSPYSTFLMQLFAALAELESNHASERIKAGLRASDKKLGRPLDEKKRAKLLKWNERKIPVKEQAKRLKRSLASVYAMRSRMKSA